MSAPNNARGLLLDLFAAAVDAADPKRAVAAAIRQGGHSRPDAILAVGKAAPAMAWGAASVYGEVPGLVVSHAMTQVPPRMTHLVSAHPIPDERSMTAGTTALQLVGALSTRSQLMVLVSGGASALIEAPIDGVTTTDIARLTDRLLRSGATIQEINTVRVGASRIKGGGLVRATDARVTTLAISDVVCNDPATIGSGLTVPPGPDGPTAAEVVTKYGNTLDLPRDVESAITRVRPPLPHAVGRFDILASASTAVDAVAMSASRLGHATFVIPQPITGDTAAQAERFVAAADLNGPGITVGGGETTVVVAGSGSGGRNQHAALVAAGLIADRTDFAFLAAGTDGRDGPTDAAGAVVDGGSVLRAEEAGHDLEVDLASFNSHTWLVASGDAFGTGPTGTNVGDIWISYLAE